MSLYTAEGGRKTLAKLRRVCLQLRPLEHGPLQCFGRQRHPSARRAPKLVLVSKPPLRGFSVDPHIFAGTSPFILLPLRELPNAVFSTRDTSPTSGMPDDTSSLRAAALLSLKSKQSQRRGGPAPSSLAQQTDTVSLIYDEPGQTSPVANSSFTGVNKPMDLDEADTDLEDGEISDSNDIQPRPPVESQTTPTERPAPQPIPAKFSVSLALKILANDMVPSNVPLQSNELKHLPSRPQPAHPVQHVRPLTGTMQHLLALTSTFIRSPRPPTMTYMLVLDRYGLVPP